MKYPVFRRNNNCVIQDKITFVRAIGTGSTGFNPANNPLDTSSTGYGGANVCFTNISAPNSTINFVTPIADGAASYFSLEEAISIATVPIVVPTPEPAACCCSAPVSA